MLYQKRENANDSACSMNVSSSPPSSLCWSRSGVISPGCTLQQCVELLKYRYLGPTFREFDLNGGVYASIFSAPRQFICTHQGGVSLIWNMESMKVKNARRYQIIRKRCWNILQWTNTPDHPQIFRYSFPSRCSEKCDNRVIYPCSCSVNSKLVRMGK